MSYFTFEHALEMIWLHFEAGATRSDFKGTGNTATESSESGEFQALAAIPLQTMLSQHVTTELSSHCGVASTRPVLSCPDQWSAMTTPFTLADASWSHVLNRRLRTGASSLMETLQVFFPLFPAFMYFF
jgi:hypothetical protein